jgi:uncharacterized protein YecE (DUF72 family)
LPDQSDVFAYFNNDWEGYAVENARALNRLLDRRLEVPSS